MLGRKKKIIPDVEIRLYLCPIHRDFVSAPIISLKPTDEYKNLDIVKKLMGIKFDQYYIEKLIAQEARTNQTPKELKELRDKLVEYNKELIVFGKGVSKKLYDKPRKVDYHKTVQILNFIEQCGSCKVVFVVDGRETT